ncbi:MAG: hypothetical protein ACUBOA_06880 [Candidatus Loosdrechtia sp.]|nr:MAG: hypothetical protein QY305_10155 [Candidatus Jettenia sp. AMX2]
MRFKEVRPAIRKGAKWKLGLGIVSFDNSANQEEMIVIIWKKFLV